MGAEVLATQLLPKGGRRDTLGDRALDFLFDIF